MQDWPPEVEAAMKSGAYGIRRAILFRFDADYGFWDSMAPVTFPSASNVHLEARGVRFDGAGSLIQVDEGRRGAAGEAPALTLTLRAVPDSRLTPDVLAEILTYDWHRKPVLFFDVYLTQAGDLIGVYLVRKGILDHLELRTGGPVQVLVGKVETPLLEDVDRGRVDEASDESQRTTWPGDTGFRHLDNASRVERWAEGVSRRTT
jgi:hypothetical protein